MLSELFNLTAYYLRFGIIMHWFGLIYSLKLLLDLSMRHLVCHIHFRPESVAVLYKCLFQGHRYYLGHMQPALFYLTPIAYPENLIAPEYKLIIKCNPMYYFIKLGRNIFMNLRPTPSNLWLKCLVAGCGYVLYWSVCFQQVKKTIYFSDINGNNDYNHKVENVHVSFWQNNVGVYSIKTSLPIAKAHLPAKLSSTASTLR
jgi:ABC-type polysaccharide/polyol phosphate export permease